MPKVRIAVSPEMLAFVGTGAIDRLDWPEAGIGVSFRLKEGTFATHPDPVAIAGSIDADLVFIVSSAACRRLFDTTIDDAGDWHLPSELRAIGLAIRDCAGPVPARETLQLAKCIELLCAVFACMGDGVLVPAESTGKLSERDARGVIAARRLIDERWHEKLTLDTIARACGLNRAKLTRGFRLMFDCTIADALAEKRLGGARQMLMASDLPVSLIGYRCGYLNNASFTRAFSRRFGIAPTRLRRTELAA